MSDLDKYTQLLKEQSQQNVQRMNLSQPMAHTATPAGEDAIKAERLQIASRLIKHYTAGSLTLEDIATATSLSMSDIMGVAERNSALKW